MLAYAEKCTLEKIRGWFKKLKPLKKEELRSFKDFERFKLREESVRR